MYINLSSFHRLCRALGQTRKGTSVFQIILRHNSERTAGTYTSDWISSVFDKNHPEPQSSDEKYIHTTRQLSLLHSLFVGPPRIRLLVSIVALNSFNQKVFKVRAISGYGRKMRSRQDRLRQRCLTVSTD